MTAPLQPFHLALPVTDLAGAEVFYCGLLGCAKGRAASRWLDLDFFGRQIPMPSVRSANVAMLT
jgi:extradiol dioxygenase family protein